MVQATWNGETIAEAEEKDMLRIEGNWYFPPSSVKRDYFSDSDTHTVCPWKGTASYYNVTVADEKNNDAAWYYHEPKDGSIERVGDFTDFVAFWRGVTVGQTTV